jgi:hypothetical protein
VTKERKSGWIIALAIVVGLIVNYFLFGPLGALIMVSIEFTVGLFVTLAYILTRRRRR